MTMTMTMTMPEASWSPSQGPKAKCPADERDEHGPRRTGDGSVFDDSPVDGSPQGEGRLVPSGTGLTLAQLESIALQANPTSMARRRSRRRSASRC